MGCCSAACPLCWGVQQGHCPGRDPEGSGGCVTASWGFWGLWGCVRASCALQAAPQAAQRGWCSCSPQNTTSQNAFAAITSKMSFCQPKARRHHQHVTGGQNPHEGEKGYSQTQGKQLKMTPNPGVTSRETHIGKPMLCEQAGQHHPALQSQLCCPSLTQGNRNSPPPEQPGQLWTGQNTLRGKKTKGERKIRERSLAQRENRKQRRTC